MSLKNNEPPKVIETDYTEFIEVPHTEELVEFSWLKFILWSVFCPVVSLMAVSVIGYVIFLVVHAYNDQGSVPSTVQTAVSGSVGKGNLEDSSGDNKKISFEDKSTRRFTGQKKLVNGLAFSPDGKYVLSGEGDSQYSNQRISFLDDQEDNIVGNSAGATKYGLYIWNYETGKPEWIREQHTNPISSVAFSQDGTKAVSTDISGNFFIWETESWTVLDQYRPEQRKEHGLEPVISFNCAVFSPDGQTLALGGSAKPANTSKNDLLRRKACVVLWDVAQHREIIKNDNVIYYEPMYNFDNQVDCVFSLAYTSRGKMLVAGVSGANSGIYILEKEGKISPVVDAATTRTAIAGQLPLYSSGHDNPTSSYIKAALKFDDTRIAAGDNHGRISLWEFQPELNEADRALAMDFTKANESIDKNIRDIKYSLDGKYLISCGDQITVRDGNVDKINLLGYLSPETQAAYQDSPYYGLCVAFTADGQSVGIGCSDKVIRIWDFKRFSTSLRKVTTLDMENKYKELNSEHIDEPESLDFRKPKIKK